MAGKPLISIIIPVFNCDKYIEQCLKSIRKQSYSNIEVICVDDGSNDKSREVTERYLTTMEVKTMFIRHDENKGVSFSRNCGLQEASGEYIVFVDGDDYIDAKMIEYMYTTISENSKVDCVIVPYKIVCDDEKKKICHKRRVYTISKNELLKQTTAVWGGMYKKSIIDNNDLYFNELMENKEDGLWLMQYTMYSRQINYVEGTCTYYRKHEGQITNKCVDLHWEIESIYNLLRYWRAWCETHVATKEQRELFWRYRRTWVNGYFDTCSKMKLHDLHDMKSTKMNYGTIINSSYKKREAIIELIMNTKMFENMNTFKILKTIISKR